MKRTLTGSGLARVLSRLDPEPSRSAAAYESLRLTLIRFFEWRRASYPDERADEALDRLVVRLDRGDPVGDVRSYALGIARNLILEHWRRPASRLVHLDPEAMDALAPRPPRDDEPWLPCLTRCLDCLPPETRGLVLRYYDGVGQPRMENRARLAAELGITEVALRKRLQRLRDRLERCVSTCASGESTPDQPVATQIGGRRK